MKAEHQPIKSSGAVPRRSADRDEIVDTDALHDQELARAILDAMHAMRGLWRHGAALPRLETVRVPRRPRLDQHRTLQAHKAVGDVAVIMPGHLLPRRQGQDRDAHIGSLGHDLAAGDLVARSEERRVAKEW